MKIPNWKKCSEVELWEYVAAHLARRGIDTVMVGGSVVAVYTEGLYQSGDIALVLTAGDRTRVAEALAEIGFLPAGRLFKHPRCDYIYLDFPIGPVAIGDDYSVVPAERVVDGITIRILSPTDCVKDRLASYIHFSARECLDQAALVAQRQTVDAKAIRKWCGKEGRLDAYEDWQRLRGK